MTVDPWRRIRAAGPGWFADRVATALGAERDQQLRAALRSSAVNGGEPVTWRGRTYTPAEQLRILAGEPVQAQLELLPDPDAAKARAAYDAITRISGD